MFIFGLCYIIGYCWITVILWIKGESLFFNYGKKAHILFKTDLSAANFCLSTSPLYGILQMSFEVDKLHIYSEAIKIRQGKPKF